MTNKIDVNMRKVPLQIISMVMVFAMFYNMLIPTEGATVPTYAGIGMQTYSRTLAMSSAGYFPVRSDDGKYGLANTSGEMSVDYTYSEIEYLCADFFQASFYDGYSGSWVIDSKGTKLYDLGAESGSAAAFGNYLVIADNFYGNFPFAYTLSGMQSATSRYGLRFYNADFKEVTVEEAFNNTNPTSRTLEKYNQVVTNNGDNGYVYSVNDGQGGTIISASSQNLLTSYWNRISSKVADIAYYKDFHGQHDSNIIGIQGIDPTSGQKVTYHVDIVNGVLYDTNLGQHTSTIDKNGYFIYEVSSGRYSVGHSEAAWIGTDLTNQPPVQSPLPNTPLYDNSVDFELPNIVYTPLLQGVKYVSYSMKIPNVNKDSYLVYGDLPVGLGLYDDGVIGGIPRETGVFAFVVETTQGQVGYSIEVVESNPWSVEQRNDFTIMQYVPTISSNQDDVVFWVTGGFYQFLNLYIDGVLLVQNVHYTIEEGSTKIVIYADTVSKLPTGQHTINATFEITDTLGSTANKGNSSQVTVNNVAQVFDKTVEPSVAPMPFTDVTPTLWHYDYVKFVYENGVFYGVSDSLFMPDATMSRSMMATILYATAGRPATGSAGYSDVGAGEWYSDAVNWVGTRGIDDSVGTFRPEEPILREEAAKMVYNYCTDQGVFLPQTTSLRPNDLDSVSANAQTAVTTLFSQGVFSGKLDNNFEPKSSLTRAETAAMMKTFLQTIR